MDPVAPPPKPLDTLPESVVHASVVRHSRFLVHAGPAAAPAEAMAFLAGVSDPAATHNCWAWRIGDAYRSSDDGEPAGTAGRPILAAIDGQAFDQVVVVVTRWFGGIKLGAGGLVRAYGGTAAECLRLAPRRPLVALADLRLACGFDDIAGVHAALVAFQATKLAEDFSSDGVAFVLRLPAHQVGALRRRLRDATRDRIRFPVA